MQTGERHRVARTSTPPDDDRVGEQPTTADPHGAGRRARPSFALDVARLRHALAPAAVYVAVRAVGVAVLGLMARAHDTPLLTELRSWDGVWMLSIARYGYDGMPVTLVDAFGRHTADTAYAFFPGYPATIAAVGLLTGGNLVGAALLVTGAAAWWRRTGRYGSPS